MLIYEHLFLGGMEENYYFDKKKLMSSPTSKFILPKATLEYR